MAPPPPRASTVDVDDRDKVRHLLTRRTAPPPTPSPPSTRLREQAEHPRFDAVDPVGERQAVGRRQPFRGTGRHLDPRMFVSCPPACCRCGAAHRSSSMAPAAASAAHRMGAGVALSKARSGRPLRACDPTGPTHFGKDAAPPRSGPTAGEDGRARLEGQRRNLAPQQARNVSGLFLFPFRAALFIRYGGGDR